MILALSYLCIFMIQLIEMLPGELEWLSNHLGHNIDIHKTAYRLHTPAIEITKVGRILLALDSLEMASFKGKKLDSLLLEGMLLT